MLDTCTSSPQVYRNLACEEIYPPATSRSSPTSADSTPSTGQARSGTGDGGEGSGASGAKGMTRAAVPVARIDGRLTIRFVVVKRHAFTVEVVVVVVVVVLAVDVVVGHGNDNEVVIVVGGSVGNFDVFIVKPLQLSHLVVHHQEVVLAAYRSEHISEEVKAGVAHAS